MHLSPQSKIVMEALCGSADDACLAAKAGADRIELNANIAAGGTTPSPGTVMVAKRLAGIPIVSMLRPRAGGFNYSDADFETMIEDGIALMEAGSVGIAFGILDAEGSVDADRCGKLMKKVPCAEWVFHRAFDVVPHPREAIERLIDLGFTRILTKGQANTFEEGESLLLELRQKAAGRIEIIVPGVRLANVRRIVHTDGFDQIHFGKMRQVEDNSNRARPEVYFGAATEGKENLYESFDEAYFREVRERALS